MRGAVKERNSLTDVVKCVNCPRTMNLRGKLRGRADHLVFQCSNGHQLAVRTSELKYGRALNAAAETMDVDDFIRVLTVRPEKIIETYPLQVWVRNPDKPGYLKWERNRSQSEVVTAVTEKLKEIGYYGAIHWISPSALQEDAQIPKFDYVAVSRHTGVNEGEKVEVGVVSVARSVAEQTTYFSVLTIKLFDKDLARLITDFLTDYLDA